MHVCIELYRSVLYCTVLCCIAELPYAGSISNVDWAWQVQETHGKPKQLQRPTNIVAQATAETNIHTGTKTTPETNSPSWTKPVIRPTAADGQETLARPTAPKQPRKRSRTGRLPGAHGLSPSFTRPAVGVSPSPGVNTPLQNDRRSCFSTLQQ